MLGLIIFSCLMIILCAKNPSLASGFSNIAVKLSKNNSNKAASLDEDDVSKADIEALLQEIEKRNSTEKDIKGGTKNLGLVSPVTYDTLDDYYRELALVIKNNYSDSSVLTFKMLISEDVFPEWYAANIQNSKTSGESFSYSADYEKEESGYAISHTVTFE